MYTLPKLITVLCVFVAAFFLVTVVGANPVNLAGTEWGFAGETGEAARFVQFRSNGKVSGYSGCNHFAGTYIQNDDALTIRPLATTRMACQPEAMKREQQFLGITGRRAPCRRKPPQTYPQGRGWQGPCKTGTAGFGLRHTEAIHLLCHL